MDLAEAFKTLLGLLTRHALTTAGGWLVRENLLGADPGSMQTFVGSGMFLAGIGWSIGHKYALGLMHRPDFSAIAKQATLPFLVLFCLTQEVRAADMPPPPVTKIVAVPAVTAASGFYFGINGAGAQTDGKFDLLTIPGTGTLHPSGGMAGITAGFGGWVTPALFVGAEADGDYDWTHQNVTCGGIMACKMKSSWFLAQRAVVGWALGSVTQAIGNKAGTAPAQWPVPLSMPASISAANIMPFVTGGFAERRFQACIDVQGCGREWISGPTFGAGIRMPVSANFAVDVTYLHTIYNKNFVPASHPVLTGSTFRATTEDALMLHLIGHL